MLISFRGYVLAFGKPDVKMADAAVAASAANPNAAAARMNLSFIII